jgi:hypothetical protein
MDPKRVPSSEMFDIFDVDIDSIIRRAVALRERLATEIDEDDPARSSAAKHRQLRELHEITSALAQIADGVIAAGLALGGKPGRVLDEAYGNLREAVKKAHPGPRGQEAENIWLESIIDRGLTPTVQTDYERWLPLHWILEAPDVLIQHGGFDAIVGNPPFLGGTKLSGAMGAGVRDWLVQMLAMGMTGKADLVAYFFLRALSLLSQDGTLGLIATNTIAQGETRAVGLGQMTSHGFTIVRAIKSRRWPAKSAAIDYSAVWGTLSAVSDETIRMADDKKVDRISTMLEEERSITAPPARLDENAAIAFEGHKPYGMGFTLGHESAEQMRRDDPKNGAVLFPFLSGDDLSASPTLSGSRSIVDFNDMTLPEAAQYELPLAHVVEFVKPERDKERQASLREKWWQYGRRRPELRKSIAGLNEVLVVVKHSKVVMPVRVSSHQVFSHALTVFATDSYEIQAVLSSSIHLLWAITYGSTLETRVRYTASDVFETFPCPRSRQSLELIGRTLDEERREIMLRRGLGLTKLYNVVNDPQITDAADTDVARLRAIHVELDKAVMDAYGWSDIALDHGFHTYRQMERWTISPAARVEILDRLLEENHRRAAAEVAATPTKTSTARKAKSKAQQEEALFS